jgi:GTP-binding protein
VPRFAEVGPPGDERDIELHLKLLADAALVGLPNAGKSSLISRISNARPKVASYPFTTLQPVLGTVESPDGRQLVIADVPGLIEGASSGLGLGHEFLAHLERARTLLHVIDASLPIEEQWRTIDAELGAYGAGIDELPQIVVLNKIDLAPDPEFTIDDPRVIAVFALSCATGEGLEEFRRRLFSLVPAAEPQERGADELADFLVYRPQPKARGWRLLRTEGGFKVLGTPPSEADLERALRAAGAKDGATVELGDEEFELA